MTPTHGPRHTIRAASTMLNFFMKVSILGLKTVAGLYLYLQVVALSQKSRNDRDQVKAFL